MLFDGIQFFLPSSNLLSILKNCIFRPFEDILKLGMVDFKGWQKLLLVP